MTKPKLTQRMPAYTAADLHLVFIYAMIDEYLKESKYRYQKQASVLELPVQLIAAEIIFVNTFFPDPLLANYK